ncbi:DUF1491 family protein [Vannielia litorea]|uniref:DUF1491 family protein n=1 Tax=Vannielia litorea TaxID=1217970 RepID=UPI001C951851|nr:DUF1491 family protein [Vannielia litorea]MBY6048628.1 DUF1491 family protein [Vannielia litorea]MBY6076042.1 DUF1491 family protein [Vannielia litorea]
MTRLTSGFWVQAYLTRLRLADIPAFVVAKGDETAGNILIKQSPLDGTARAFQRIMAMDGSRPWDVLAEGPEAEVDAALRDQRRFDPDLWVIEVEDREGRHLLDEEGLG